MPNKRATKRREAFEEETWKQQPTAKDKTAEKHDGDSEHASKKALLTQNLEALEVVPTTPSSTPCSTSHLFIASLGNPAPYENSRHSAGHIILRALHSRLGLAKATRSKAYAGGLLSEGVSGTGAKLTLWQCPSYMNDSGASVLKAYRHCITTVQNSGAGTLPPLILLHDEMEAAPGDLKVGSGFTSARGHNGVKSVQQSLRSAGLVKLLTEGDGAAGFLRVGVGIGRPAGASRQRGEIEAYVLGTLGEGEREEMEHISAKKLMDLLEEGIPRWSCTG